MVALRSDLVTRPVAIRELLPHVVYSAQGVVVRGRNPVVERFSEGTMENTRSLYDVRSRLDIAVNIALEGFTGSNADIVPSYQPIHERLYS